jgi:hypothetical protein
MDLGVEDLLNAVRADLVREGTSSRDLVAIEFDAAGNVDVLTLKQSHAVGYPDLAAIFRTVGQTCLKDRIGVRQLRRIELLDGEIRLELLSRAGEQHIVYHYALDEMTNAPAKKTAQR